MTTIFHGLLLAQAAEESMSFKSVLLISLAVILGLILLVLA